MTPSILVRACLALLAAFLLISGGSNCLAQVSFRLDDMQGDAARLEQALKTRGSIEAVELPLRELVQKLARQFGVSFAISEKKLEEAGIQTDTPVTKSFRSVPLKSILRHTLNDLELTYTIRDHMIVITTPEDAESRLETRVYPVRDLVVYSFTSAGGKKYVEDYESLMDLITTTISPHSWEEVGGPGTIDDFENAGILVISQTGDVHDEIEPLLVKLRQVKSYQGIPSPALSSSTTAAKPAKRRIADRRPAAVPLGVEPASSAAWQVPQVYEDE